ncbi:MAG: hypothetical protein KDB03_19540 [Planctomycetales bacterium]|nr:hypothetical protein [Planctomycetales bacterium]
MLRHLRCKTRSAMGPFGHKFQSIFFAKGVGLCDRTLSNVRTAAFSLVPPPPITTLAWLLSAFFFIGNGSNTLVAGLTPSEVVVVVNGRSLNSRTLANHYVALRKIPSSNVVVLDDVPASEVISIDDFRDKVLRPLLAEIEKRKIAGNIQCVAYSTDFPTSIDISSDLAALGQLPIVYTKNASINALTYYYAFVLAKDPGFIDLQANFYARRPIDAYFQNPAGKQTDAVWREIQQLIQDEKHIEAAQKLSQLAKEMPGHFPIFYLAAGEYALAGDAMNAIRQLTAAVSAGWLAGGYLKSDNRFKTLHERADFQSLLAALDPEMTEYQPPVSFNAKFSWTKSGLPTQVPQHGVRYLLSTVLGVTRGGGLSLGEAISALERTATADQTFPKGTFSFCLTSDVRTTTRQANFPAAINRLRRLGFDAHLISRELPQMDDAVLGVQFGLATFDWPTCGSQFVPGALADNLTSTGGYFAATGGQTKMTEVLRYGAAGCSGTVTEPYSLQEKFPHPLMYVYYASGATLAEAFYLSVTGPYQLLIVGDPLCKPFSGAPKFDVDNSLRYFKTGESLSFDVDVSGKSFDDVSLDGPAWAEWARPLRPAAIAVLFDGKLLSVGAAQSHVNLRLVNQPDGFHEVTVRLVSDDPLQQSSELRFPIWMGEQNSKDFVQFSTPALKEKQHSGGVPLDRPLEISFRDEFLKLQVTSPGAKSISLLHDAEVLASESNSQAEFAVRLEQLGMGPVRLQAMAVLENGDVMTSVPFDLNIAP